MATPADTNMPHVEDANLYALVAEFDEVDEIMEAAHAARKAGYKKIDAHTPFPVEGLDQALGMENTRLGWIVLGMGIVGLLVGFGMQWYSNTIFYPLNIGGKPLNSWPNFVVITFEMTVLFSAFTAGLFMIGRNGLPRLYHPIFNTPNFENATRDKFFLSIEARDEKFDRAKTKSFLEGLGANRVSEVEH
jgi:hypothetical protein